MKKKLFLLIFAVEICIVLFSLTTFAAENKNSSTTSSSFNRMTIKYSAQTPAKLTVSYTEDTILQTDVFYLEAGEDTEFSALNKSYLNAKTARNLKIISAESLTGGDDPVIHSVSGKKIPVYSKSVLYLDGSRYKVGIKLSWGGGISEIHDKNNPVSGLTNLINNHDTGRNIQQSYYGVEKDEHYTQGKYGGILWPYNPVQGGDLYDMPSRLIDIVVKKNSVQIKAQPADWALNNSLTPSYMENTFTLTEDCIRVDNRFVDFSGLNHPERTQEIPAIYVVRWLDDFVWYAGNKSWTDDELSWDTKLPGFDIHETEQMRKRLYNGQTEVWGAWVNKDEDYGIGLYIPGADYFLVKRDSRPTTKDAGSDATNYIAPIDSMKIVSYEPIEYSYLITTGSVKSIRDTFEKNKDFAVNEYLDRSSRGRIYAADYTSLDFTQPVSAEAFKSPSNDALVKYDETQNAVCLISDTGEDPYLTLNYDSSTLKLSADKYSTLLLTYMIPETNSRKFYDGEVFLCAGKYTSTRAGMSKLIPEIIADGQWHTIAVDLAAKFWKGDIHSIRLDFFNNCAAGDMMYIRNITLCPDIDYTAVDFSELKSAHIFTRPQNDTAAVYDNEHNAVRLTSNNGKDPYITLNYDSSAVKLSADKYSTLALTYMVPKTNSREKYIGEIFLCAGEQIRTKAGISKIIPEIIADGEWHTITIDLTADFWKGDIHSIRLDFFNNCAPGDVMYVRKIAMQQ